MKKSMIALAVLTLLSGCAAPARVQTLVPVPVACQEAEPDRPAMPTEGLKPGVDLHTFTKSAAAEIELREGYEEQLRTALQACIKPVASSRP